MTLRLFRTIHKYPELFYLTLRHTFTTEGGVAVLITDFKSPSRNMFIHVQKCTVSID